MILFDNDEEVIIEVRKHWFVMLGHGVGLVFLAFIPIVFYGALETFIDFEKYIAANIPALFGLIYSLWVLMLWVYFFIDWTDYYLDVLYVTNKRIVDVEQRGFFSREVIHLPYSSVQDVTCDTRGVIATFFNYGDLHIQTAGENRVIMLRHASQAEHARKVINDQHARVVGGYLQTHTPPKPASSGHTPT